MAVITISRQFGAGGKTLGTMVAERLGYTFVDNEIIQMVATEAKVSKTWVESIEKEAGGTLQRLITNLVSKSLVERILSGERGYIDEEIYVDTLRKIITKLAEADNVVIIGRGGQYILQDDPKTLHILLVGDFEHRVEFMEKHYNLNNKQATQAVTLDDRRRVSLYRKFGKEDYDNPDLYHLVLNMNRVELNKGCDLVVKLVSLNA
jgi:cytidylate kinase